ncbi:type II toxin-antitoxin system VapC family toxin [Actinoallomurus purpureus]|uniref:type II toxin-antitoxin system VapC family toxin n=1 Tax=Actinoallomurus purpureus TaxID=478114 RepID=UPI002092B936|nr:type II toxin-antitoxin system VapC family toxin [Actinoallomurus purpureus]MCO6006769.1 type II toxin-antitoxin system VapC family toxin [Actinoallomurus purpureus]
MIVIDASVLIDALTADGPEGQAARKAANVDSSWAAPAHLITEVSSGIRGRLLGSKISRPRAEEAIRVLAELEIELADVRTLLPRIWELRGNLTTYDAAYVALAETYDCPLITQDARLSNAPGARCEIQVVGA